MQENMTMTMQVILFVTDGNSNSNLYSIHSTAINRFLPGLVGVCNYCYVSQAGRSEQVFLSFNNFIFRTSAWMRSYSTPPAVLNSSLTRHSWWWANIIGVLLDIFHGNPTLILN